MSERKPLTDEERTGLEAWAQAAAGSHRWNRARTCLRYEATIQDKEQQLGRLIVAAQHALVAIRMIPIDALGTGVAPDGSYSWPFRDELISELESAIKEATHG